jgi:DnaJ domain
MDENEARRLLAVSAEASPDRIKAAYREMLKDWHPDRFAGDVERSLEAADRTRRIVTAYRMLSEAPSPGMMSSGRSDSEPFEESLWNQWNPFHPSHDRYGGPNTVWDRVAIAGLIVIGVIGLVIAAVFSL